MHRFVLAEFNTHRAFSRNSASSRAIPVAKQIERVRMDPALPVVWPVERSGMQGGDQLPDAIEGEARGHWMLARDEAVARAEAMVALGVHKSVTNRLLEPFMWHTAIVSATEWDNFWTQRCSPLAQPEMRVAAEAMKVAYDESVPQEINFGGWHMPYTGVDEEERFQIEREIIMPREAREISVARCARVSYLTQDGRRDVAEDLKLYDRLVSASPPHASPLEHVATPVHASEAPPRGNFQGWRQLRHLVLAESVVAA
jgi:thymidylate synthase ThyX